MTARIEKVKERIFLVSDSPVTGARLGIAGSRFSKEGGPHWSIPLSLDACRTLREVFGQGLKIGPDLTAWAKEAKTREAEMGALTRASDATLEEVPNYSPVLAAAMGARTYQRVAARFIERGRSVLLADDPGLGKTLEAIAGVIESGTRGPYLVVCPKTAVETVWAREIPRWWPGQQVVTLPDARADRDAILFKFLAKVNRPHFYEEDMARTWVVVNPEMMRTISYWVCDECGHRTPLKNGIKQLDCQHNPSKSKTIHEHNFPQLFAPEWGAIILDESHRMLIRTPGRPTQTRNGANLLQLREGGVRIAISGTPFRNKPHLLWGTLNWLRPKEFSAYGRWADTYFSKTLGFNGYATYGDLLPQKEAALYRNLDTIMLRRTKAEVATDLPPKAYVGSPLDPTDSLSPVGVWLPMTKAQAKSHAAILAGGSLDLEGGTLNALGYLAELTRMKQFATCAGRMAGNGESFVPALPSNKFDHLVGMLEEMGFPDVPSGKVVVVSQFTSVLNLFAEELLHRHKIESCKITGEVTGKRRQETIDLFNQRDSGPHLMLLNTKAGGVAITIDSADDMVFLDETHVADDQTQAEDRIHRVSNPRPVRYHYLRSLDSVEEAIAVANAERADTSQRIMDGRRGVEYVRRVLELMAK